MIEKQGKIFIDGKVMPNRYDKNEAYGANVAEQLVEFYEITKEIFTAKPKNISEKYKLAIEILKAIDSDCKITISKQVRLRQQTDFMRLAFDPPAEILNAER